MTAPMSSAAPPCTHRTPRWKHVLIGTAVAAITITMVPATASASTAHSATAVRTTACPVFDLSGSYHVGGPAHPVMSQLGGSLTVDMSAFGRPTATGVVISCGSDYMYIWVRFPDDHAYTGVVQALGVIHWVENGTFWIKTGIVPDVRGLNELDATAILISAGFVKGAVANFTDRQCYFEDGVVATQSPSAGSSVVLRTAVSLRIARKPRTCP
jgi:hypothetical protein